MLKLVNLCRLFSNKLFMKIIRHETESISDFLDRRISAALLDATGSPLQPVIQSDITGNGGPNFDSCGFDLRHYGEFDRRLLVNFWDLEKGDIFLFANFIRQFGICVLCSVAAGRRVNSVVIKPMFADYQFSIKRGESFFNSSLHPLKLVI